MASDGKNPVVAVIDRLQAFRREHDRRMAEDPEYRKEQEEIRKRLETNEEGWESISVSARRKASGIPERLLHLIESPKESPAIQAVRAFLEPTNTKTMLILAGGVGCGKTVAAAWAIDSRKTGLFVKAVELVRHGTYDREFWEQLGASPLLAIDDLGTEPRDEKGWAAANLDALLDARYDGARKTILTTNLTADDFKARYCAGAGIRTLDRIREIGTFFAVPGDSMRRVSA